MTHRRICFIYLLFYSTICVSQTNEWMAEYSFSFLDEVLTSAQFDTRYASKNNFIGRPIQGYTSDRQVMTAAAAKALSSAELELLELGYGLKVFDAYRPQRAVNDFIQWSTDAADTVMRSQYYPEQDKAHLFELGYISTRSGHSRGSTVDLTLYYLDTGEEVDMGGPYDYFGELSHHTFRHITKEQKTNRILLKQIMSKAGFRAYSKEWWHYTLRGEPYPDRYFDYVVAGEK